MQLASDAWIICDDVIVAMRLSMTSCQLVSSERSANGQKNHQNAPESNTYKNITESHMNILQNGLCNAFQAGSNAVNRRSLAATVAERLGLAQGDCREKFKN